MWRAKVNFPFPLGNYKCFPSLFFPSLICGTIVRKPSGHLSLNKRAIDNKDQQFRESNIGGSVILF